MKSAYDVIIVGGGIVGAAAALAIAKQTSLSVALVEAKAKHASDDTRVSAISHASKHFLTYLGVWQAIQSKCISPYTKMRVWDAEGSGLVLFDAREIGEANLGYVIEDHVIRHSLMEKYAQHIDYLCPIKIVELNETAESITLITNDDQHLKTNLLVAADGANSWVRQARHIDLKSYDYQHTAIVATVHTSLSHQHTAWQRFLPSGPLAFLPLTNLHACSIVWSATHDYASHLMQLNDADFQSELAKQFDYMLGDVTQVTKRHAFPLWMRHAKSYVQHRVALIGDAAHTIHPLAGQGVNLGLMDAAALAKVIKKAYDKNRDYSSLATLRRYERIRKADIMIMLAMVELLKQLFASEYTTVKCLRNTGLNVANNILLLKRFFTYYASGKHTELNLEESCF